MSLTNKLTGKVGSMTISATPIGFQVLSAKVDRTLADATDSTDYDVTSDLIWPTQLPVKVVITLTVEGRYNLVTTPGTVTTTLFTGAAAVPVVLKNNATSIFGHGNFDVSNYEHKAPIDDVMTFTATLQSNGVFTPGS